MKIAENFRKLVQSREEPITIVQRGVKYAKVENGWVPILNELTISLIDFNKITENNKKIQISVVN